MPKDPKEHREQYCKNDEGTVGSINTKLAHDIEGDESEIQAMEQQTRTKPDT